MSYEIVYDPYFVRNYKKIDPNLKEEIKEKIEKLKDKNNHDSLKVHKLKGRLSKFYSFSVNYSHKIVFEFLEKDKIILLKLGDHDIYHK